MIEEISVAQNDLTKLAEENSENEYRQYWQLRRRWLRDAFSKYRDYPANSPESRYLTHILTLDVKFCRESSEENRRRHNSFVLYYATGQRRTLRQVAFMQGLTVRGVCRDIDHTLDRLMLLAFGVDGIPPETLGIVSESEAM